MKKIARKRNRIIEGYIFNQEGHSKNFVQLIPDKPLAPGYYNPPIIWQGNLDHEEVEITQVSRFAYSEKDFDFSKLPEKFDYLKQELIEAINDAMKTMD